jgi:hypothetical protein
MSRVTGLSQSFVQFRPARDGLFGARVGGVIIRVCGLNVDPYAKDSTIARVRRLYVLKAYYGH